MSFQIFGGTSTKQNRVIVKLVCHLWCLINEVKSSVLKKMCKSSQEPSTILLCHEESMETYPQKVGIQEHVWILGIFLFVPK